MVRLWPALLLCATVVLAACSVGAGVAPITTITEADGGRTIAVPLHQHIQAVLVTDGNAGYTWYGQDFDATILTPLPQPDAHGPTPPPGESLKVFLRFDPIQRGTTSIHFVYANPSQPGEPPLKEFTVNVTVH